MMKKKTVFISLLIFILFLLSVCNKKNKFLGKKKINYHNNKYRYETDVELYGILKIAYTNDINLIPTGYYRLELNKPITVIGNKNDDLNYDTFSNIRYIQLAYWGEFKKYLNYTNKNIIVRGKLFERFNANHFTQVLLELKSINIK